MKTGVFRVRHQRQILGSVVAWIAVDVMHDFATLQDAAECLSHHEPVFKHIAIGASMRIVRSVNDNVPMP